MKEMSPLGPGWGRALAAGVSVHLANVAVTVLVSVVLAFAATVAPVMEEAAGRVASQTATWGVPVLAALAAAWVAHGTARGTARGSALPHALLAGHLAAAGPLLGLLGPPSLPVAGITLAAALLGGLVGAGAGDEP